MPHPIFAAETFTRDQLPVVLRLDRFPQMPQLESDVARGWLWSSGGGFESLSFNVRMTLGLDPGPEWPEYLRRQQRLSSAPRADIIGWTPELVTIAEVSPVIGFGKVGQVLGYGHLFERADPGRRPPRLLLVGLRLMPETAELAARYGVDVELVQAVNVEGAPTHEPVAPSGPPAGFSALPGQ